MSEFNEGLKAHLQTTVTTTCRCWVLVRRDGEVMGFTDHDLPLEFEGVTFRADTGLSALALQQSTGLSVDNTEAMGALSDAAIREDDIEAGRYDGAEVQAWLVNWQNVEERQLQFRGLIGEMRRQGGAFEAELRGLTDVLNQPYGRIYQRPCGAVLGDRACGFDLETPAYFAECAVEGVEERRAFRFAALEGYAAEWFQFGVLRVLSGKAEGLSGLIKRDSEDAKGRLIELWHPLRAEIRPGDLLRLIAGCDKRSETCRKKFDNYLNFQGFPDIPGDDWSVTDPTRAGRLNGKSRRR
ncbi:hypothetical protein ROA7450_02266 [Roseovarius albus]|uniref:Bacteriophage phiJL001 Gp84 C-terminal domain-containing protein n=1 Tax=Roseovarius albus TaxID=1247867 RepID=A0A1X6ZD28_9RHOB|nr:DUF2163 domain-containing protein [Roseovarius albus]SLN46197.1 hypothetical protein ROA7450_02266 [Roseovarius albus]